MNQKKRLDSQNPQQRLTSAYESEKSRLMGRVRSAGKSLEETVDLIHDVYTETWGLLDSLMEIINLPAWLNSLVTSRLVDSWRHDMVRRRVGETDMAEDTLNEILSGVGLDPLDAYVRSCLVEALDQAKKTLPDTQKKVVEAQVFGGGNFYRTGNRDWGKYRYTKSEEALCCEESLKKTEILVR